MLDRVQFLHILAAESELLVDILIYLTNEAKGRFKHQLNDAFASNGYSDTTKAWNEETSWAVQEALDQYLIPCWYEVVSSMVVGGGQGYSYYPLW